MPDIIKLGRSKGKLVSVTSKEVLKWQGEGYLKAVNVATLTGFRRAANKVRDIAVQTAPVDPGTHRVVRRYPSGFVSSAADPDAFRLSDKKNYKVRAGRQRGTGNSFYAYVRVKAGYSIFLEYGTRNNPEQSWLRDALGKNASQIIPLLRAGWPK